MLKQSLRSILGVALSFIFVHIPATARSPRPDFSRKADELFVNYSSTDPPFGWDDYHKVDVQVGLYLSKILGLNMIEGKITVSAWLRLKWLDQRLSFNGSEHFGAIWQNYTRVALDPSRIWKPDIWLASATSGFGDAWIVETSASLYDRETEEAENYNLFWSRPGIFESQCKMNLKRFPFDDQTCALIFESWIYHGGFIELVPMISGWIQDTSIAWDPTSEDWTYAGVDININHKEYNAASGSWPSCSFLLRVMRNPQYYMMHGILPLMLLVSLSMNASWFGVAAEHSGSGERIGFSLTLLLTVFATMLFTAEGRPKTRDIMWMDTFQMTCISLTCLPIMWTAIVFLMQRNDAALLVIAKKLMRGRCKDVYEAVSHWAAGLHHRDMRADSKEVGREESHSSLEHQATQFVHAFDLIFRGLFPVLVTERIFHSTNQIVRSDPDKRDGFWDYAVQAELMYSVIVASWVTGLIGGFFSFLLGVIAIMRIAKPKDARASGSAKVSAPVEAAAEPTDAAAPASASTSGPSSADASTSASADGAAPASADAAALDIVAPASSRHETAEF